MRISEAVEKLQKIQEEHGDLVFGMENVEFCTFFPVSKIEVRSLEQTGDYLSNDDEALGILFVGVS